ncbi:uncharacterized protein I206_100808 [Kwoniella pini CBS 10737]|uniref:Uncharacterized protein n=1 Tax=Kwoniella pini CBS 10737 TaxID=1296096 RepID=A0A1B9IC36_9TREE|nr:uncharacterized protein I206_00519 [Kwoniella pini CBS 10737]OCF53218.1 hypothetical protein I206_00519 [Kwoniella pini CBS 10737]
MVSLNQHSVRALSPITELKTPTSLRTLRLPLEEADYLSERSIHHEGDDDASVYSQSSAAETVRGPIKQQIEDSEPVTPPKRLRTLSSPSNPTPPPRSPRQNLPLSYNGSNPSLVRIPFPRQNSTSNTTPCPGGLPPPPRSTSVSKPKLIRRVTPPTTPTTYPENQAGVPIDRSNVILDRMREHSAIINNMAGVGAGKSLSQQNANPSPSDDTISGEEGKSPNSDVDYSPIKVDVLHNVPIVTVDSLDEVARIPPQSRPNSLKKEPANLRSRPNSFHGSSSRGQSTMNVVSPALGLYPVAIPGPVRAEDEVVDTIDSHFPLKDSVRPILVSHQSDSSLHIRSKSVRSVAPARKSPRRRRVSSIFSSIFGIESDKEHVARKLSKSSRKTSGSRGSSRAPSPNGPTSDSPVDGGQGDFIEPIQTAIRTSGTFGIRDDGSELSNNANKADFGSPRHNFERTGSGNGSVITHSDGVKRVLYVENLVGTPEIEEDKDPDVQQTTRQLSGDGEGLSNQIRTPPHSKVTPVAMLGLLPNGSSVHHSPLIAAQSSSELFPPTVRAPSFTVLPLNGSTPSPGTFKTCNHYRLSHGPGSTTTSTDVQYSSDSHLPLGGTKENLVDASIQTSLQSSPAKSARSRPLPRPPSTGTTPVGTPQPTSIPPFPPSTLPSADLPLLIASHLLSTHAAALIRHSSSMKEVSETMHRMARESLDWGGILMGMANRTDSSEETHNTYKRSEDSNGYEGLPFSRPSSSRPDPAPNSSAKHEGFHDPRQEAYDTLTRERAARPGIPNISDLQPRGEIRKRKGESLPADLLKDAERLGAEGWTNLHKAESAWSEAMRGLTNLIRAQSIAESEGQEDEGQSPTGMASILPLPEQMGYLPAQVAHPRYSATNFGHHQTSIIASPDIREHTSMSFLPDEHDMSRSPITPSASSQSHFSFPQAHVQGHPFQQSQPEIKDHSQNASERTIKRPQSAQLPSRFHDRQFILTKPAPLEPQACSQGYTLEHLRFISASHSPVSASIIMGRGEEKKTPSSRSTMNSASSHPSTLSYSHSQEGKSTTKTTKKLAKKYPYPPTSTSDKASRILGIENVPIPFNGGAGSKNGSLRSEGGKKHWWNRKKDN